MRLIISFDTNYEFIINLRDNDFVRRWANLLEEEVSRTELLQEDSYSCFLTEEEIKIKLISAIEEINKFTKREFISIPKPTDWDSEDFYNKLHEKFEQLAGPDYDTPTKIMVIGPKKIKDAIRQINRFCHALERRPYTQDNKMRIEFLNSKRKELLPNDYLLFENNFGNNVVYLDYNTLGKSLAECFKDNLPPTYPGMKVQKHYGPNFVIKFSSNEPFPEKEFIDWLKQYQIEDIPVQELGVIVLGEYYDQDAYELIKQTKQITGIRIERD